MFSGTSEYPQPGVTPLGIDESTTSTAEAARPLPLFWGTQKLGVTFISNAFNQRAAPRSISTGKSDEVVGYDYYLQFAAVICHGPVDALHEIRYNDKPIWKPDAPLVRGAEDYVDLTLETQYGTTWRWHWGTETQETDHPPALDPRAAAANHTTGQITLAGHEFAEGTKVIFAATMLPAGLAPRRAYFVRTVDADHFQAALTLGGTALSFTTDGAGLTVRRAHAPEHDGPFYLSDLAEPWWPTSGASRVVEFHPALRGQCYFVARQHALGYNTTQVPQIEVIVSRWPGGAGKIGAAGREDIALTSVVTDAFTHPRYGLGLPATALDATSAAATLATLTSEGLGISPFLDRAQPFAEFLREMLGYVDGFCRAQPDGTLAFGLNRGVPCSAATTGAIVFDESCLADAPHIDCPAINTTRTEARVQFRNGEVAFKDDCCAGHSAGTLQMTGAPAAQILQRPWVTRLGLADKMARAAVKQLSLPAARGTLTVRKSRLQGLALGGAFYLCYAHYGLCWLHCRSTAIRARDPFAPAVEVEFEQDLGYLNSEAYDAAATYTPPSVPAVAPPDFTTGLLLELPASGAAPASAWPQFVALASRPSDAAGALVGGCAIAWEDDAALGHFTPVSRAATAQPFPVQLSLLADATASATSVSVQVLSPWDALPEEILAPATGQVDWLLVFAAAGIDEIMAVTALTLESDGSYTLGVTRGALDTAPQAISSSGAGLLCYAVRYGALNSLRFTIPQALAVSDTVNVKLQSVIGTRASSASTALELSATYRARTQRPWKALGDVASWPATWGDATTSLTITWDPQFKTNPPPLTWDGPRWVIDARLSSDAFDITNPAAGRLYTGQEGPLATSHTLAATALAAALGGRQTFTLRLYATQGGVASLHWDEKEITYV